jgi:hypothetical protein
MQLPIINHLTGRDYQNGGDINAAMREHADRCAKIRQVIAEIEIIAESII